MSEQTKDRPKPKLSSEEWRQIKFMLRYLLMVVLLVVGIMLLIGVATNGFG